MEIEFGIWPRKIQYTSESCLTIDGSYFPPQIHMVKSSLPMWWYLKMYHFCMVHLGDVPYFCLSASLCPFLSVISAMRGYNSYLAIWKPGRQLSSEPHHSGVTLRWQRYRSGRSLSPPQIHWKIIWMLNRFHKTTSEHWRRTSSTQKGSPFSSKEVGQNIKDKKRVKRVRNGDPPQGGSCEGGEVYKHQETLSPAGLWGSLESQREGNNKQTNKQPTDYAPNHNSQWRSSPEAHICQQWMGAEEGGRCGLHYLG